MSPYDADTDDGDADSDEGKSLAQILAEETAAIEASARSLGLEPAEEEHQPKPAAETTTIWPSMMSDLSSHPAHGRVTRTRSPTGSAHQTAAW